MSGTIPYHLFDGRGVYAATITIDPKKPLPENGTTTAPPEVLEGEFAVWGGGQWRVVTEPPAWPEPPAPTAEMVDAERDRRIDAGFIFDGVFYQSRPQDRENIAGAKSAATDAVLIHGAEVGDYSWRQLLDPNGPEVFAWIAADNSLTPMDAPTVIRFGYAALAHKESLIFKARVLKNMDPIPADYAEDAWWQ